eukprot:4407834-Prorocentrum_lima.AAC.1
MAWNKETHGELGSPMLNWSGWHGLRYPMCHRADGFTCQCYQEHLAQPGKLLVTAGIGQWQE